jgi:hypothetical protein
MREKALKFLILSFCAAVAYGSFEGMLWVLRGMK